MKLKDNLNDVELDNFYAYSRIWFTKDDEDHHANGPSFVESTGFKEYCINALWHNTKGPAYIYTNGRKDYWLNGEMLTEKEWHEAKR